MNQAKRKHLEAKDWKFGSAADFLEPDRAADPVREPTERMCPPARNSLGATPQADHV